MLTLKFVTEYCKNNIDLLKISNQGTHFHGRCPLCGDSEKSKTKKRFHLDWNNSEPIFHCFNCDASGNFYNLYSKLENIDYDEAEKNFKDLNNLKELLSDTKEKKQSDDKIVKETFLHDISNILSSCISDIDVVEAFSLKRYQEILKEFRADRCIPEFYPLYYCIDNTSKYFQRIIIPIFIDNKLVYFQARGSNPKYLNPKIPKSNIIFRNTQFDKDKYIIITEGLLDSIICDNATTILGKELNDDMIGELFKQTDKGIIIALDKDDSGKKSTNNFLKNSKFSEKVLYFRNPGEEKDLNEIKQKNKNIDIYSYVIANSKNKLSFTINEKLKV